MILPASYQKLGHVGIIRLPAGLMEKKRIIGEGVLNAIPGIRTCCLNRGPVQGEFRQPDMEYLAGEHHFEVVHKEHDCIFRFDITKLMWSMGNMNERKRLYQAVKPGEVVVDFFAGMGYWSIPIAKHAHPGHVYAIDANPYAIEALRENRHANKIPESIMTILPGKCEEVAPRLGRIADRVILGYLPAPRFALYPAFHCLKEKGGIIHYEGVCGLDAYEGLFQEVRDIGMSVGFEVALKHAQPVKSMSAGKWHYVLDCQVSRLGE